MESDHSSDHEAKKNNIVVDSVLCYLANKRKKINHEKLKHLVQRHFTSAEIQRAYRLLKRLTTFARPVDANGRSSNGAPCGDPGVGSIIKILDAAKHNGWPLPEFAAVDISHFPDCNNASKCSSADSYHSQLFDCCKVHCGPALTRRRTPASDQCEAATTDSHLLLNILEELGAVKRMVERVTSAALYGRAPTSPQASDGHSTPPLASLGSPRDEAPVGGSDEEATEEEADDEEECAVESPDVPPTEGDSLNDDHAPESRATPANVTRQPTTGGRSIENAVAKLKAIRATTPESSKVKEEELSDESQGSTRAPGATPTIDLLKRNSAINAYSAHQMQLNMVATINTLAQQQQQQRCAIFGAPQATNRSAFHHLLPAPYSELMNAVLYPHSKLQSSASLQFQFPTDAKNRPANEESRETRPSETGNSVNADERDSEDQEEQWNLRVHANSAAEQKLKLSSSIFDGMDVDKQLLHKRPMNKCQTDAESDSKPYICQHDNCNKRFANKFLLKKHEFIHTGERPHQCNYCSKRFNRKDNLLRHKKTHQASSYPFSLPDDGHGDRNRHNAIVPKRKHRPVSCSSFQKFSMLTSPPIRAETGDKLSALLSMKYECKSGGKSSDGSTDHAGESNAQVNDEEEEFPQDLRVPQQSC